MEPETIKVSAKDFIQLKKDVELIKNHLLEETELTDWAKEELENARNRPLTECISHDEVGKLLLKK